MTVKEALGLQSLKNARLVAGRDGADREISHVMVLEAADIESWGRKGLLILTSYYALKDMSGEEMADFFTKIDKIGVSGIIFKKERLLSEIPDSLIRLCDQCSIPLIDISGDTRYESIITEIMSDMLDSKLLLLNRFYDIHNQIMAFSLTHPDPGQILAYLKENIGFNVTLLAEERSRRTGTDPVLGGFTGYELSETEPSGLQHHKYYNTLLTYPSGNTENAVSVLVPSDDGSRYYLVIHCAPPGLAEIDRMTIENVVSLLQMEILKENAVRQQQFHRLNGNVRNLLTGRYISRDRAEGMLSELGLDKYPVYQVAQVSFRSGICDSEDSSAAVSALIRKLRARYMDCAYMDNGDQLCFIFGLPDNGEAVTGSVLEELILSSLLEADCPLLPFTATISETCPRHMLEEAYRQVSSMLAFFGTDSQEQLCLDYSSLGLYKLILNEKDINETVKYLDPRVVRLKDEDYHLFETLVSVCENRHNLKQAAGKLFLHPKTVAYRVNKAKELYGIDTNSMDDMLQIMFAKKLYNLFGKKESL